MNFLKFVLICTACLPLLIAIVCAMSGMWLFAVTFFLLSLVCDVVWFNYEMENDHE